MAGMQIHQSPFLYHNQFPTTYSQPQTSDWTDEDEDEVEVEYELLGVISRGAFGVVHKALNKETNTIVAMKEELEGMSETTVAEIETLKTLGPHPCIVRFERVATVGERVFVVMEYAKSDVERWRQERGKPYSLDETRYIIEEILKGLAFLHENGVMHRDIKPANILIGEKAEVKICDFGLSARFGTYPGRRRDPDVGTLCYKAPELLLGAPTHTCAVDMWSVGCVMAELLVDQLFFPGDTEGQQLGFIEIAVKPPFNFLHQKMAHAAKYSEAAAALSPAGLDLLKRLLAYEPNKRIKAREALDHAWFREELV